MGVQTFTSRPFLLGFEDVDILNAPAFNDGIAQTSLEVNDNLEAKRHGLSQLSDSADQQRLLWRCVLPV